MQIGARLALGIDHRLLCHYGKCARLHQHAQQHVAHPRQSGRFASTVLPLQTDARFDVYPPKTHDDGSDAVGLEKKKSIAWFQLM
jgi:hypothetical protein